MLPSLYRYGIAGLALGLDRSFARQGRPFTSPAMMVPHLNSRFYGWTHYGMMIPDLPAPHHFFSLMSLIGANGTLAFDTDDVLVDAPRRSATVVTGTALSHPAHFGAYSIPNDCEIAADGSVVAFGREVRIEGRYPLFRVRVGLPSLELDLAVRATDTVSWFVKSPVYDHISLLSHYDGVIRVDGRAQTVSGLCTFEYAASIGPYSLFSRPLAPRSKLPMNYFTYHIINLPDGVQLLLAGSMFRSRWAGPRLYVRGLDRPDRIVDGAVFEVLEYQKEPVLTPDGRRVHLPLRFSWRVPSAQGVLLELSGTVDTPMLYGLGTGHVGGYVYEGSFDGHAISGRGYMEHIDRRDG